MMEGVVKWYNKEKGFGFIETDDTEYFVHHSFVEDEVEVLEQGDKVTFEVECTRVGNIASNVKKVEGKDEN